jgi:hypothetical protein
MTDEDACSLAAETCLSWWEKRDEMAETDNILWDMSEQRINELACDPGKARAYLAERRANRSEMKWPRQIISTGRCQNSESTS